MKRLVPFALLVLALAVGSACKKNPAATPSAPAPFPGSASSNRPSGSMTTPSGLSEVAPPPPIIPVDSSISAASLGDPMAAASVETINRDSPLQAVFFAYDSDSLDEIARSTMAYNADVMRKYATWVVTVEGHCDERGTAEYNLALGDRRAQAVKNYLVSLGIGAERMRTVSYGNEFPFATGHDETAWSKNRRAHFMLTAK